MGGLGRKCVAKDVREQFNHYEIIVDIYIPRIKGVTRGFAFVQFKHVEDIEHLLKVNAVIKMRGKRVSFERAQKHREVVSREVGGKGKANMAHPTSDSTKLDKKSGASLEESSKSFCKALVGNVSTALVGALRLLG